jgi:hypothetical protein
MGRWMLSIWWSLVAAAVGGKTLLEVSLGFSN